ncbi:MAG: hypothetical protein IJ769_05890 [Clostridia bacterium]|nr:hypothetical protein [Clostridia bacterium]
MARIGLKGLTYAKVNGGGSGSPVTYTGGKAVPDLLVKADVKYDRDSAKQYADNRAVESANGVSGGTIDMETASLPDDQITDLIGYALENGALVITDDEAPYMGVGYITCEIMGGKKSFKGYWYYKVQFSLNEDSAETKGQSTSFQNSNISGDILGVVQSEAGKVDYGRTKTEATEAAVRAWLNGLAGIN